VLTYSLHAVMIEKLVSGIYQRIKSNKIIVYLNMRDIDLKSSISIGILTKNSCLDQQNKLIAYIYGK
jgi:regulator of RNase E activity RraA